MQVQGIEVFVSSDPEDFKPDDAWVEVTHTGESGQSRTQFRLIAGQVEFFNMPDSDFG